jgi:hypothetical protein
MKKVIAFTGPKGVGKTTFANYFADWAILELSELTYASVCSFAQPIKEMLKPLLDSWAFNAENKEKAEFGLCGKTPREMLQTLGTEWGRKLIGKDIWLEVMKDRISDSKSNLILIDDLRFVNEAEFLKANYDTTIILLKRDGIEYTGEHASEQPLPEYFIDEVIDLKNGVAFDSGEYNFYPLLGLKKPQTIYIAGPMRGYPEFNFPAFDCAKEYLEGKGWEVISPADLDRQMGIEGIGKIGNEVFPPDVLKQFVKQDVEAIQKCDAIYMLQGWQNSKGARAEKALAEWLGLKIIEEGDLEDGLLKYGAITESRPSEQYIEVIQRSESIPTNDPFLHLKL